MPSEASKILYQLIEDSKTSPEISAQIKDLFTESITDVLKKSNCVVCPIPDEARSEIGHLTGMIRDMGSGDMYKGIEVMREQNKIVKRWGELEQRVGHVVLKTAVTFVIAMLLGATVFGLFGSKLPLGK